MIPERNKRLRLCATLGALWIICGAMVARPAAPSHFVNAMAGESGVPETIVINEILAHSDDSDAVELLNIGEMPVDISGWLLTDDLTKAQSLWARIPSGTVLAPGAYYVSWQIDQNRGNWSFGLSEAGETVHLLRPDPAGGPPLPVQQVSFGASPNNVSFVRYVDSTGRVHYPLQAGRPTLGAANRGPRLSPVVIEEIMHHPPGGGEEYVVIANVSGLPIPLYDPGFPGNAWKFVGQDQNGRSHDMLVFPTAVQLDPYERIVLAEGDPAALRQRYGISESLRIFRWQRGGLNNRRERIALMEPQPPEADGVTVYYVVADAVEYNYDPDSGLPLWPDASGNGLALARVDGRAFGDDPANWHAIAPLRKVAPRLYLPWVSVETAEAE
ncbi:MAG: lamin tail domain-containing protein [Caldilinea sp.]|nr:lamin tail domain-containing protein [Caldilinea sp.]MDW8438871.1 lamin tail domain-containing protein [Caldilineaceae bacterium]